MKLTCPASVFILLFVLFSAEIAAASGDTLKCHLPLPARGRKGSLIQPFYYAGTKSGCAVLDIRLLRYDTADTAAVFRYKGTHRLKKGAGSLRLKLDDRTLTEFNTEYQQLLKALGALPVGQYLLSLDIFLPGDTITRIFHYTEDSSLSSFSPASSAIGASLLQASGRQENKGVNPSLAFSRARKKLLRRLAAKGFTTTSRQANGSEILDLHYNGKFIRYYRIPAANPLAAIEAEQRRAREHGAAMVGAELESFQSVFTGLKQKDEDSKEVTGELSFNAYAANDQEEYSGTGNRYYELAAEISLPFKYMPLSLQGFYTSQDMHRRVKSSFLKLHYDTEQAKAELQKLISSYRDKHEGVKAKGDNLQGMYASYLGGLRSRKNILSADILKLPGGKDLLSLPDTSELRRRLTDSIAGRLEKAAPDSLSADPSAKAERLKKARDSAAALHTRILDKRRELEATEARIRKYEALLAQYKNANYFDSLVGYSKLKDLDEEALSYRQLSRKAEGILPDGKSRSFLTGITHIDAGIFSKEISSYTLAGQTVKGLDAGYDFGIFQTAVTAGNVEYINRQGVTDQYTTLSARAAFAPLPKTKATLIYYTYTPGSRMLRDNEFFKDIDLAAPSFRSPVHIVSLLYEARLPKGISLAGEAASSFRKETPGGRAALLSPQHMAYKLTGEGDIPRTPFSLRAAYEHMGKDFENASLPLNGGGTDLVKTGIKGTFFRGFLSASIDYNYLQQQSLSFKGGNTRWGFEIATRSKRYPSLSLSYKPFSTFRSAADTFATPGRLLRGSVWTGKGSYQLKRKGYNLRFTLVCNSNKTEGDSMEQQSRVVQLSTLYGSGRWNLSATLGTSDIKGSGSMPPADSTGQGSGDRNNAYASTRNLALTQSLNLDEQWTLHGGEEIAAGSGLLLRWGLNAGCGYTFKKLPVRVSLSSRFSRYRQPMDTGVWKTIAGADLGVTWQFSFPLDRPGL